MTQDKFPYNFLKAIADAGPDTPACLRGETIPLDFYVVYDYIFDNSIGGPKGTTLMNAVYRRGESYAAVAAHAHITENQARAMVKFAIDKIRKKMKIVVLLGIPGATRYYENRIEELLTENEKLSKATNCDGHT